VQLLDTGPQALAEDFAAAQGDEAVRELVALALRVLRVPGVEVGQDAFAPQVVEGDDGGEDRQQHGGDEEEHARVDAAQEEDAHGDGGYHQEGAHVGLTQQQQADEGHRHHHRRDGAEELLARIHAPHHVVGGVQGNRQLGHFAGLEVHDAQGNPAPRVVHHLAHERQQHDHQQHQRDDEDHRRLLLPEADRHLHRDQRDDEGNRQRHHVALQEEGRRVVGELGVVGQRHAGRIDHHQAQGDECTHHRNQGLVEGHQPHRVVAADGDAVAHRQRTRVALAGGEPSLDRRQRRVHAWPPSAAKACTACTKTSARWA